MLLLGAARRPGGVQPRVDPGHGDESACVPRCTMRPASTTITSSASSAAFSRWAIVTVVRPAASDSSAADRRISVAGSMALVASSSTSRSGSARWARATATSWRSPADSDSPRWPTGACQPAGQAGEPVGEAQLVEDAGDLGVGGAGTAVADVLGDGALEQVALLRHHDDPPAQRGERDLARAGRPTSSIEPRTGSIEPGEQLGERRLAAAGLADDGDPGPRRDRQVDVAQHLRAAGVGVARRHGSGCRSGPAGSSRPPPDAIRRIGDVDRGVEHVEHPAQARERVLGVVQGLGRDLHRPDEERHQEQERDQPAGRKVAADAEPDADHARRRRWPARRPARRRRR